MGPMALVEAPYITLVDDLLEAHYIVVLEGQYGSYPESCIEEAK